MWDVRQLVIAAAVASTGGCFVELGGGYYPSVSQTVTLPSGAPLESGGGAWCANIKVGFFVDVVLDTLGFAFGYSPVGTNLVIAKPRAQAGGGHMLRADFVLPPSLLSSLTFRGRVVSELDLFTDTGVRPPGATDYTDHGEGGGHRFFLGAGVSHTASYGSQLFQIGLERTTIHTPEYVPNDGSTGEPALATSAWGASASITISVLPAKHPEGIYDYRTATPDISPGAGACDPQVCDPVTGVCTQKCYGPSK